jgi:hypothetical protein
MTTNTPMADALMLRIRNQYPHESAERHRKRFIEIVRNGDPDLREEIVNSLFGVFLQRPADKRAPQSAEDVESF